MSSLTSAHQVGDGDDGERDAGAPHGRESHRCRSYFPTPPWYLPMYSSSLAVSRGHEAAGSLFRLRLKSLCLWACVCVTSPRTRATVRERIRVFCQVLRSAEAGLPSVSKHTHTFLFTRDFKTTVWSVFLSSFSLQLLKKKKKMIANKGGPVWASGQS